MNAWWLILLVAFWNMAEGNLVMGFLLGFLCLIFGDFE